MGSSLGKNFLTNAWLTTATNCEVAVSASVKPRPRITGCPTVSKNFGFTRSHDEPLWAFGPGSGRPSTNTPSPQLLPSNTLYERQPNALDSGLRCELLLQSLVQRRQFLRLCIRHPRRRGAPHSDCSVSSPKFWCSRLRRVFVSKPALTSMTSESAAWNTISPFCGSAPRSRVERFAPRRASAGSACEVIHAGTMPNTTPVTRDNRKANPNTGSEGLASIGMLCAVGNASARIIRVPA